MRPAVRDSFQDLVSRQELDQQLIFFYMESPEQMAECHFRTRTRSIERDPSVPQILYGMDRGTRRHDEMDRFHVQGSDEADCLEWAGHKWTLPGKGKLGHIFLGQGKFHFFLPEQFYIGNGAVRMDGIPFCIGDGLEQGFFKFRRDP